ncbi:Putative nudix hydrolase 2 [Toxocara canis]|uniref:Putative nudix hydrolase 2 n=1 Tax=Toxocara canis TaxID=6265 RepID=A0A0B2VAR7_TOXCA|nr:Putative nudix hydrolase 2 [Toxocara canis]
MNQKGAIDLCTSTTVLSNECPFQLVDQPNVVYRGQWTKTIKTRYRQREGETEKVCESIHRKAPTAGRPHCVEVITILHKGGNDYFVFIKEYRIPMNGYCFEFPAGN